MSRSSKCSYKIHHHKTIHKFQTFYTEISFNSIFLNFLKSPCTNKKGMLSHLIIKKFLQSQVQPYLRYLNKELQAKSTTGGNKMYSSLCSTGSVHTPHMESSESELQAT